MCMCACVCVCACADGSKAENIWPMRHPKSFVFAQVVAAFPLRPGVSDWGWGSAWARIEKTTGDERGDSSWGKSRLLQSSLAHRPGGLCWGAPTSPRENVENKLDQDHVGRANASVTALPTQNKLTAVPQLFTSSLVLLSIFGSWCCGIVN